MATGSQYDHWVWLKLRGFEIGLCVVVKGWDWTWVKDLRCKYPNGSGWGNVHGTGWGGLVLQDQDLSEVMVLGQCRVSSGCVMLKCSTSALGIWCLSVLLLHWVYDAQEFYCFCTGYVMLECSATSVLGVGHMSVLLLHWLWDARVFNFWQFNS